MNFPQLLQQREALLRQTRLANLAFAFARLGVYAARIARAGLHGPVTLHEPDPDAERFWPTLVPHAGNQSVIDEHFLEEEVDELDELLLFLEEEGFAVDYTFDLEAMPQRLLPELRRELEKAGVALPPGSSCEEPSRGLD